MRDLILITPTEKSNWCLDFDIINGVPRYVPYERNTQDQRAAVATYMLKGSIPGKPELGIGWGNLYQSDYEETLTAIDNEIKQAIQEYAAVPEGPNSMYVPVYNKQEEGVGVTIYQG